MNLPDAVNAMLYVVFMLHATMSTTVLSVAAIANVAVYASVAFIIQQLGTCACLKA